MMEKLIVNEDMLLSRKEVAARLAVCARTVDQMVKHSELPPPLRRAKRWVRFRIEDVDACVRQILRLDSPVNPGE